MLFEITLGFVELFIIYKIISCAFTIYKLKENPKIEFINKYKDI